MPGYCLFHVRTIVLLHIVRKKKKIDTYKMAELKYLFFCNQLSYTEKHQGTVVTRHSNCSEVVVRVWKMILTIFFNFDCFLNEYLMLKRYT